MRKRDWSWGGLLIVASCGAEALPVNSPSEINAPMPDASRSDASMRDAAPINSMDASDCHQPPYLPATQPAGVRVAQCKKDDAPVFRFELGSGVAPTEDQANAFLDKHRAMFHAVEGIVGSGYGFCCAEDVKPNPPPNTLCIAFDLRLCSTPLSEFVETVRKIQASDSALSNRTLRISVELQGLTGPRCAKDDDNCGPLPYTEKNQRPAPTLRTPVDPINMQSKPCSYDGECVANGCGNGCDHWTLGDMIGTCPYITKYEDAYCGCVQERCAWFH